MFNYKLKSNMNTAVIFLGSMLVFFLSMNRDLNIFDEGIILVGAMRVLDGDVPHRDFYHCYGPAQLYIVAALTKLFGPSILVPRLYGMAVCALIIVLADVLMRRCVSPVFRLIGIGFALAFIIANQSYLYPIFPPVALALLGSVVLLSNRGLVDIRACLFAGACAGAAALFRYESGFFIVVAHLASIVVLVPATNMAERVRKVFLPILAYGLAAAAVFAPFAISFLLVGGLPGFINDIVDYPVHYYADMRGLPFPGISALREHPAEIGVYFPVIAIVAAAIEAVRNRSWRRSDEAGVLAWRLTVMMVLLTLVFFYKGSVRVSPLHMLMAIVPASILLALVAENLIRQNWRPAALALLAVAGIGPLLGLAREAVLDLRDPGRAMATWMVLPKAADAACSTPADDRLIRVSSDYLRTANFLRVHTRPGEEIFVGLPRHDRILINPVAIYFLADRLPGTAWHYFDPGMQTRAETQRKMVRDLKAHDVDWVVRDASFDAIREPNGSARSSRAFDLDRYLAQEYRKVTQSGEVSIWLSRDAAMPKTQSRASGRACLPVSQAGAAR